MPERPFDPWSDLRSLTAARIGLGHAGGSLPTRELLDFGLAHSRARDAVLASFNIERLTGEFQAAGLDPIPVETVVTSRDEYLRRPDLGRLLSDNSRRTVQKMASQSPACDLVMIVSDGLSALAAQRHALAVAANLHSRLVHEGWKIAPLFIARFGRVALEDEIGEMFSAQFALILLGERPGIGSPDSLGAYFVYQPRVGRTDADRNCVSNIRPQGLPPLAAVETLHHLLTTARHRKLSGVLLKDERLLDRTAVCKLPATGPDTFDKPN